MKSYRDNCEWNETISLFFLLRGEVGGEGACRGLRARGESKWFPVGSQGSYSFNTSVPQTHSLNTKNWEGRNQFFSWHWAQGFWMQVYMVSMTKSITELNESSSSRSEYRVGPNHRWQTQGPQAESALHLVSSGPAPCFYSAAAPSSLPLVKE